MTFFTQEKGTLLPEKGHLAKLGWGGLTPRGPPGSYAPEYTNLFAFCREVSIASLS
jgi:hypothetical protein